MKSYLTTLCYLVKGDKVLMLHRVVKKNDVNKDKWIGVGGHFEKNESPEDCARREIFEETGLVVTKLDLRGVVTFISGKLDHAEYMFLFLARDWTGTPHECDEGVLAWTDFEAVKKLELWEGDRIFLKLVSENHPFFSLKLTYDANDLLKEAVLDGEKMELFDILGEDGKPTGLVRERSVVHEMGTLHQTVHMWVVRKRPDGSYDLLVQKRARILAALTSRRQATCTRETGWKRALCGNSPRSLASRLRIRTLPLPLTTAPTMKACSMGGLSGTRSSPMSMSMRNRWTSKSSPSRRKRWSRCSGSAFRTSRLLS